MNARNFHPESLMMSYGYNHEEAAGAVKCPIYQTSTFAFSSAEEGKAFFELAYGLRKGEAGEEPGFIYSRLNNPNVEILEQRLCLWEGAAACAAFESGMAAISTVFLEFLRPGDLLLYSRPIYGGTSHLITEVMTRFGVEVVDFMAGESETGIMERLLEEGHTGRPAMVYVETPANPTNTLFDLVALRRLADKLSTPGRPVLLVVDNTYLGPIWQQPLQWGADLVLYSATKYLAGHSDVIAGACLGSRELIDRVRTLRTFLGSVISPMNAWLLLRSLETLRLRMERQATNAALIARFLECQPAVSSVRYLGLLTPDDGAEYDLYLRQCLGPGAMISFEICGGEKGAFAFLNQLRLIHLAVSLGSTESLIQHPATMTHAGIPPAEQAHIGIGPGLVRLSVGVEHPDDLIADLRQAIRAVDRNLGQGGKESAWIPDASIDLINTTVFQ